MITCSFFKLLYLVELVASHFVIAIVINHIVVGTESVTPKHTFDYTVILYKCLELF